MATTKPREAAKKDEPEFAPEWRAAVAASPLRVESRTGPHGGAINAPVWVEPVSRGGTPMCGALDRAQ